MSVRVLPSDDQRDAGTDQPQGQRDVGDRRELRIDPVVSGIFRFIAVP